MSKTVLELEEITSQYTERMSKEELISKVFFLESLVIDRVEERIAKEINSISKGLIDIHFMQILFKVIFKK